MKKKDYLILVIHSIIMIALMLLILECIFFNDFHTPFSSGDNYTPWETNAWKAVTSSGTYKLTGPISTDKEKTSTIDKEDNRYIVPLTPETKRLCWLYRWRVKLTFLAALAGALLYFIYKKKYCGKCPSWVRAALAGLHVCFFIIAFYGTMCIRWWGYG